MTRKALLKLSKKRTQNKPAAMPIQAENQVVRFKTWSARIEAILANPGVAAFKTFHNIKAVFLIDSHR